MPFTYVAQYIQNDFEMVWFAPIFTGITFICTLHIHCIYIVRSLYFKIFSYSFLITFISPEIAGHLPQSSIFIFAHYDVQFIVRDGSVRFQFLIP